MRRPALPLALVAALSLTLAACGAPLDTPETGKDVAGFPSGSERESLTVVAPLQSGVPTVPLAGAKSSFTWLHFDLPAGATNLTARLGTGTSATNDADLYLRAGGEDASAFDCQSVAIGLTDACTLATPVPGPYSVLLYGYTAFSGAVLTVSWTPAVIATPPPLRPMGASLSVHLQLGLPDGSTQSPAMPERYLSLRPQFAMSYNATRKEPNWVSWELNASWLGAANRTTSFRTDSTLPALFTQAALADYTYSGFDCGHLCPSADRTLNATDNAATFVLSNVVPQAPDSNRGPWEKLETYARTLVASGKELTVIAGGLYGPLPRTIGSGVVVPDALFKVIVVADAPGVASVNVSTRVIAVVVPNDDSQVAATDDWRTYRTSARAIETASGLDFLSDVPRAVQDAVEPSVDAY